MYAHSLDVKEKQQLWTQKEKEDRHRIRFRHQAKAREPEKWGACDRLRVSLRVSRLSVSVSEHFCFSAHLISLQSIRIHRNSLSLCQRMNSQEF